MINKILQNREYSENLKKITFKVGVFFIIIMILGIVVFMFDIGGLATQLMGFFDETIENLSGLFDEEGNISTLALIFNNVRVSFLALFFGLIPFLFLPVFVLIINAALVGVLLGLVSGEGILIGIFTFLLGILPHGILELPAIFISISAGLILCSTITKTILRRNQKFTISEAFINGLKTVVFICVPLMILAGIIETQITPRLLLMMM